MNFRIGIKIELWTTNSNLNWSNCKPGNYGINISNHTLCGLPLLHKFHCVFAQFFSTNCSLFDPENMYHVLILLVDDQLKSKTSLQSQVSTQAPQPAVLPVGAATTSAPTLLQPRFHWSHAFLAVGLLAASGAGTAVLFKVSRAMLLNLFLDISYLVSALYMLKSVWLCSHTLNYNCF